MDRKDQNKVIAAGFIIIRKDDYPTPRIKVRHTENTDYRTYQKFKTKAERDRLFNDLLSDNKVISD